MSETSPLLDPPSLQPETTRRYHAVYIFFGILFLASFGQAMTLQASNDAKYLIICKWASIDQDRCFTDPTASTLEGILLGYANVFAGFASIVSLLFISHFINLFGIRPVVIGASLTGLGQAVLYWGLLVAPRAHYLWAVVPEVLSTFSFFASAQFLASIYISESVQDAQYRTVYLGWMTGVISTVNIVAPAAGGVLLLYLSIPNLYLLSMVFNIAGIAATVLYLPESHHKTEQRPSIFEAVKLLTCNFVEDPKRRKTTRKLVVFVVCSSILSNTVLFVQTVYVKSRFGWGAVENGSLSSAGETISLIAVTMIAPIVIAQLSSRRTRFDNDYDAVDSILSTYHVVVNLGAAAIKALLPAPRTFFAVQCLAQLDSVSSATILSNTLKYAPPGLITSFWVGVIYTLQLLMIPVVMVTLSLYTKFLQVLPESIFWAALVGWGGLLVLVSTIKARR